MIVKRIRQSDIKFVGTVPVTGRVEVEDPRGGTKLLATRPHAGDAGAWDLRAVDVGDGYVAALAVEGRIAGVSYVEDA